MLGVVPTSERDGKFKAGSHFFLMALCSDDERNSFHHFYFG